MTDRPWPPSGLTQLVWHRVVPAPPTTFTDDGRREPPMDADAAKRAARKREKAARKRQRGQK